MRFETKPMSNPDGQQWTMPLTWMELAGHPPRIESFSPQEVARFADALQVIEMHLPLGKQSGLVVYGDILLDCLFNNAPWTSELLTWLGESLSLFKDALGFRDLTAMLSNAARRAEAFELLTLGDMFRRAAFIVEFEPVVGRKRPDLSIREKHEWRLYLELRKIGESEQEKRAAESLFEVAQAFQLEFPMVVLTGKIERTLSKFTRQRLLGKLRDAAQRALSTSSCVDVPMPGAAYLVVGPRNLSEELQYVAQRLGMQAGSVHGPSANVDEVSRTWKKIEEEAKHFPKGTSGLVIIENQRLLMGSGKDLGRMMDELAEAVFDLPQLIGLVIYTELIAPSAECGHWKLNEHEYVQRSRFRILGQRFVLLRNENYQGSLPMDARDRVFRAFSQGMH